MKVVHFHNGSGGGVLSVIRNLLANRQHVEVENHVIYVIDREQVPYFELPQLQGAATEQVFYYSRYWNFYYTCRKLSRLLPGSDAVILAHDWLELGMVSALGLNNPVVQMLHGDYDYYFQLALRHEAHINGFITVAAGMERRLRALIPRRSDAIRYLRFPVPDIDVRHKEGNQLRILFAGRCEPQKGYPLLPEIDAQLRRMKVFVEWHIAGKNSDLPKQQKLWSEDAKVVFYGQASPSHMREIMGRSDILILPSLAEGMPLVVIEAMKAGAIPLVNDLGGGVEELVENDVTGYRIRNNRPEEYALYIQRLSLNVVLRERLSVAASKRARDMFNPVTNTAAIEDFIGQATQIKMEKFPCKVYGSRLDHPWIPNYITTLVRKMH